MSGYRLTSVILRNNMTVLVQESIDDIQKKTAAAVDAAEADKRTPLLAQPTVGIDLTGWHGGRVRINALDIFYLEERPAS